MRALSIAVALTLLFGCESEAETSAAESHEAPDPVAPVEVDPSAPRTASVTGEGSASPTAPTTGEPPAGTDEELRTRIAELEEQLAACQSGSATAPTEVTVRDPEPTASAASSQTRRGRAAADDEDDEDDRPPNLIEQVFGGRRGQGDEGDEEDGPVLLDPSRILGR